MAAETLPDTPRYDWTWRHFAALMLGNLALAFGPMFVRLADSGPVSAGFWRLTLASPVLWLLARANRQPLAGFGRSAWWAIAGAGVLFALDLASWHAGIERTRLGNATLFGNSGSLILMAVGLFTLKRRPSALEFASIGSALVGAALLFGRSLQIGTATLVGDLLCVLAGLFYVGYILLLQDQRVRIGSWALLVWSSVTGAPVVLAIALAMGEPVWPHTWWPLLALALSSQIVGQGMLVYALKHFPPLVIGLVLLTQPAVAILAGWVVFGERLMWLDGIGMALVGLALVLARAGEKA